MAGAETPVVLRRGEPGAPDVLCFVCGRRAPAADSWLLVTPAATGLGACISCLGERLDIEVVRSRLRDLTGRHLEAAVIFHRAAQGEMIILDIPPGQAPAN